MTPDGITTKDWAKVERVAYVVTNALLQEDELLAKVHRERLREVLADLESRYGRIPSVLATRADFSDCAAQAIALHEEVLRVATDPVSPRLSLQSLIGLLIDEGCHGDVIGGHLAQLEMVTGDEESDLQ